jgi:hypothetical protein
VEADLKKLSWWGKILRMAENRLPKKVLQEMRQHPRSFRWYTEVCNLQLSYKIKFSEIAQGGWKSKLKRAVHYAAWRTWDKEAAENPRLENMIRDEHVGGSAHQVTNSKESQIVCRARIGDVYSIAGEAETTRCKVCKVENENIIWHIIWECEGVEGGELRNKISTELGEMKPSLRKTLNSGTREIVIAIGKLLCRWMECRTAGEEPRLKHG